jgi:DNA-binding IclR family transcriptional regulator
MNKPKSDYVIQTVQNALRLLEAFHDTPELGVSELARRLDLHKNNVFRLLATLELNGYIEQSDATERYRLGARCLELGRTFAAGSRLLDRARPVLEQLCAEFTESAHLGVLQDLEVVHLDGELPQQLVLASSRLGKRLPAHATALGKVLLGHSADAQRAEFVARLQSGPIASRTPATITDADKFIEHLHSVRSRGFALDLEECEEGLCCAAVPVFGADGACVAALSVSGPASRVTPDRLHREILPVLTERVEQLSAQLGNA